jgi:hypothetical protein
MKRLTLLLIALMVVLTGCGTPAVASIPTPQYSPEQLALLDFTRQTLQIEGKRVELINWLGGQSRGLTPYKSWLVGKYYLNGVAPNTPNPPAPIPPSGLEGMSSLTNKLLSLDCPQSMQSIKDSLISIYNSEIRQFQLWQLKDAASEVDASFYLEINWQNLDEWEQKPWQLGYSMRQMKDSAWYKLQSFRRDVYSKWDDILKRNGLDSSFVNK